MKELPETVVPLSAKWILLDSTDLFEVHIADLVCQLLPVKGTKVQWHSNKQCTHALYMYMYVARTCIPPNCAADTGEVVHTQTLNTTDSI